MYTKKNEQVLEQIAEYKSKAAEAQEKKLSTKSQLAQLVFAIHNIYTTVSGPEKKITPKSVVRSLNSEKKKALTPKKKDCIGAFDDPKYNTRLAILQINDVITKFLKDHKETVAQLEQDPKTKAIINEKLAY